MAHPLDMILNPRSIAVCGASNNIMKMGTMQALTLINQGYTGEVRFVHPRETAVLERPTYNSPLEMPDPVDLALIITPPKVVPELLEQFGKAGTRHALIVSGGFSEKGEDGAILQERIREIAAEYGIRFVGPNCIGAINMAAGFNCTYFLNQNPLPGRIGLVSQSGTYVTQSLCWLDANGIALARAVSVGNEADIDLVDVLEYMGEQEDVQAIALYIEGIRRGPQFVAAARRIAAKKPIVALYVGGTGAGARSGGSHTGALASPDAIMDGLLEQAGVVRVQSVFEMYHLTYALAHQPPMKGKRIAILTHSGGPATTIADAADRAGLQVPEFSAALQDKLSPYVPPTGSYRNPIDLTFFMELELMVTTLPELVLESGEVDGLVIHGITGRRMGKLMFDNISCRLPGVTFDDMVTMFSANDPLPRFFEMPERFGLPIVHSAFHDREDETMRRLVEAGIPTHESPEQAAHTIAAMARSWETRERILRGKPVSATVEPRRATQCLIETMRAQGRTVAAEHEAREVLAEWGIPLVPAKLVHDAREAAERAGAIDGPVALKVSAAGLAHKTERGLIALGLEGGPAVEAAADELLHKAQDLTDPLLLVMPMVSTARELVAGVVRRPGLGPCVMFGLGGILTEVLGQTAWRLAPFGEEEALAMLDATPAGRLLDDIRGMGDVGRKPVAQTLGRLGELALAHPEIGEIDLNPLVVCRGSRLSLAALDALVILT